METCRVRALRLESHVIELRCQADEAGRAIESLQQALAEVERVLEGGGCAASSDLSVAGGAAAGTEIALAIRRDGRPDRLSPDKGKDT